MKYSFCCAAGITYLACWTSTCNCPEGKQREHHAQLHRVVTNHPDRFFPVAEPEGSRSGEIQSSPIRLFKIVRKN